MLTRALSGPFGAVLGRALFIDGVCGMVRKDKFWISFFASVGKLSDIEQERLASTLEHAANQIRDGLRLVPPSPPAAPHSPPHPPRQGPN